MNTQSKINKIEKATIVIIILHLQNLQKANYQDIIVRLRNETTMKEQNNTSTENNYINYTIPIRNDLLNF